MPLDSTIRRRRHERQAQHLAVRMTGTGKAGWRGGSDPDAEVKAIHARSFAGIG